MLRLRIYEIVKSNAYDTSSEYVLKANYLVENYDSFKSLIELETYTFVIDINQITDSIFPLAEEDKFHFFEFYIDGVLTEQGYINNFTVSPNGQKITITGDGLLYSLVTAPALPYFYTQEVQIVEIIKYLIENQVPQLATNPSVFDLQLEPPYPVDSFSPEFLIKTMEDPVESISIFLGEEKSIWSQINKICEYAEQPLYVRYREFTSPFRRCIELGTFEKDVQFTYDNKNILALNVVNIKEIPIGMSFPYGGSYTVAGLLVPVTLLYTTKTAKPNFPYDTAVDENWVKDENIYDNVLPNKSELLLFKDIVPETATDPPLAEIQRASNNLYKRTVSYLKKNKNVYEFTITTEEFIDEIELGSRIRVNYSPTSTFYDSVLGKVKTVQISNLKIEGYFYVKSIGINIDQTGKTTYQLTLSDSNNFRSNNGDVVLYKNAVKDKTQVTNQAILTALGSNNKLGFYTAEINVAPGGSTTHIFDKLADADFGDIDALDYPTNLSPIDYFEAWIEDRQLSNVGFISDPTAGVATFEVSVSNTSGNNPVTLNVLVRFSL